MKLFSCVLLVAAGVVVAIQPSGLTLTPSSEVDYFIPEDTVAAQKALLASLDGLGNGDEVYIAAYSFTWQPIVAALQKDEATGAKVHLLLDRSESMTPAEHTALTELAAVLPSSDLTLTTAGVHSKEPSAIFHWKAFVVLHKDGSVVCWEGSVNFTASGWNEGNSARLFTSKDWAIRFIQYFHEHQAWAVEHSPK